MESRWTCSLIAVSGRYLETPPCAREENSEASRKRKKEKYDNDYDYDYDNNNTDACRMKATEKRREGISLLFGCHLLLCNTTTPAASIFDISYVFPPFRQIKHTHMRVKENLTALPVVSFTLFHFAHGWNKQSRNSSCGCTDLRLRSLRNGTVLLTTAGNEERGVYIRH
ncbi:hypothetical protein EDD21DRAFT_243436 [Dissophora ornata]|nr:hypothetical protein EDD21DRAFT_243436 [Dissophora ornata]